MAVICPTITAKNEHQYREQMERIAPFVTRVHVDFMDGDFVPTNSPPIDKAWWPHAVQADLHIMYKYPMEYIDQIIALNPVLVIVHAEAEGNYVEFSEALHKSGIKVGVALLPTTKVNIIASSLDSIDHVLIFSGKLGHFGGKADMTLLDKVKELKKLKPELEIGWDGGINDKNARDLVKAGVNVLNVGGYIQQSKSPKKSYDELTGLLVGR